MTVLPAPLRHRPGPSRAEGGLLGLAVLLLGLACLGPALPAGTHQHAFADQRALWGIPCALDVLSNLPFAAAGLWGLRLLRRVERPAMDTASRVFAALFFAGLVCTAVGSGLYHGVPDDAGLLWDRLGMVLPFAGLLGLAAGGRVSARAGWAAAGTVLLAGPAAVLWWSTTGNLLPWAVVQLGGMLVVLALALLPRRAGTLPVHLGAVIAMYALAKLFEAADHAVFGATAQWVSGHSLKHVLAAGAAWPVLMALDALAASRHSRAPRPAFAAMCGQNGAHTMGVARGQGFRPRVRRAIPTHTAATADPLETRRNA
jgi:hypothetical protein